MLRACNSLFYHIVQSRNHLSQPNQSFFSQFLHHLLVDQLYSTEVCFCSFVTKSNQVSIYIHQMYSTVSIGPSQMESAHWIFRGWASNQISQRGGGGRLDRISGFRGGSWERGGDFFQGGCSFYIKIKLKSEIFHDKKYS